MRSNTVNINHLRTNYSLEQLEEKNINKNPFKQFELWMRIALERNLYEPNAMNLSTVSKKGKPSSRIVLLRGFDNRGFVFYTNYFSRKGIEMVSNPYAALTFFWAPLEKQVRIEGSVVKVSKATSDAYFKSRPRESQIGAWASHQSELIKSRSELDKTVENLTLKFEGKSIPRPPHWGGFCLIPDRIEFWQGRLNRLHDRILYEKKKGSNWKISRLSP